MFVDDCASARARTGVAWRRYTARSRTDKCDRVWKPAETLRRKPQLPHMVCGFFVRAPTFGGSDGRARALPVSCKSFPVFQPVRAAALVWKRVRRL